MDFTRRQFFKAAGGALGASSLAALGFSPARALAEARTFKLAHATETRSTCPYCSVGCGVIMYSRGRDKNVASEIFHLEGDADNPVNRGTLCPKGAALIDFVNSPNRVRYPEYRGPGEKEFRRVSWDWALDRVAALMKEDRDKNIVVKSAAGVPVNRWTSTAFLVTAASSNESGYITGKVIRALGGAAIDNQARL